MTVCDRLVKLQVQILLTIPCMLQGGKLTSPQQPDIVRLMKLGSEEKLWFRAPRRIHVALLRGSTADLDGNISFERETLYLDGLNQVCLP